MRTRRIHVTGASGSGVTTLGRELAGAFAIPHHDVDDFYWLPTEIPYTDKRPSADRLQLMRELFIPRPAWVLTGSLSGWGDPLIEHFDLVVFVSTPTDIRLARLREREARRFGATATAPGGWRAKELEEFLDWAAGYEASEFTGRSRAVHEAWLQALACPVVRVDGQQPPAALGSAVMATFPLDQETT